MQQNVEIPDVILSIHPAISAAVLQAAASNARPSVDLIDPVLLADSAFLNKLQGEVNSWIKEIQNVTKLNRDVASGTASQEINFWLSMEKALEGIEEQLRSDPIGEPFPWIWLYVKQYPDLHSRDRCISADARHPQARQTIPCDRFVHRRYRAQGSD